MACPLLWIIVFGLLHCFFVFDGILIYDPIKLYFSFSGINLTCSGYTGDQEDYNCSMDVKKGQDLYEFLLLGTNPLGAANTSLGFNVRERSK